MNTPATAPLLLQNGFGFEELCTIDNDVVVGVTDVKIVTITTPHIDSNCDVVGGTILVDTTSVDVCCVQVVVDVVEDSGTNFDAHVELVVCEDVVVGRDTALEESPPPVVLVGDTTLPVGRDILISGE